ncbi:hypothetical protein KXX35_003773, partial [Aspergillus fumigatus]
TEADLCSLASSLDQLSTAHICQANPYPTCVSSSPCPHTGDAVPYTSRGTAPQCQELPLRVIYQSHSLIAKNLLFGKRSLSARALLSCNTVSIHETSPYRARPANGRRILPPTRGPLPYPNFAQKGENVESQ